MVTATRTKGKEQEPDVRVLVLVMSSRVGHYPALRKMQEETWDAIKVPGVTTIYYMADLRTKLIENILYVQGKEDRIEMHTRTVRAIKELLPMKWDYLFKTDNSAYVNKPVLVEIIKSLPDKRTYAGKLYHGKDVPLSRNFMWGEGFLLSRDMAELVASSPEKQVGIDDIEIAEIMRSKGVPFREIPFYDYFLDKRPLSLVHIYRCVPKDDQTKEPWRKTIHAFNDIHQHLIKTYYGKERRASQNGQYQEAPQQESKQKGYTRKDKTVKAEDQQALQKTL